EQVRDAAGRHQLADCILRNSASANTARSPDENTLNSIANNLARDTTGPSDCWPIKAASFPIRGVTSRCVHGGFHAAGQRLADLIAGHKQALAVGSARGMEFKLL